MFLTSFTATGEYRWTFRVGGPGYEFGSDVIVDDQDNIFVVGGANAGTDFDPTDGVDVPPIAGDAWDAYLMRINADGTYAWARTFGGTDYEVGQELAIDSLGHLVIVGRFRSTDADFDPGEGEDLHSSVGDYDVFVTQFSVDGDYGWTRTLGSDDRDEGVGVALDSAGMVYFVGYIAQNADPKTPVDMDPTHGVDSYWPRDEDFFVTKLTPDGSYEWSMVWGSTGFDEVDAIAIDACDNLAYTGAPGSGVPTS